MFIEVAGATHPAYEAGFPAGSRLQLRLKQTPDVAKEGREVFSPGFAEDLLRRCDERTEETQVIPRLRCYESGCDGEMMEVESAYSDFISCDRTGRRNAVPDIKGEGAKVGTGDLTKDMAQMDLKAPEEEGTIASQSPQGEVAGSQEGQEKEGPS